MSNMQKIMQAVLWCMILIAAGMLIGRGILILKENHGQRGKEILGKVYEIAGEKASELYIPGFTQEEKSSNPVQAVVRWAENVVPYVRYLMNHQLQEPMIEDDATSKEVMETVDARLKEQMLSENQSDAVEKENQKVLEEQQNLQQEEQKNEESKEEKTAGASVPVAEIPEEQLRDFNYLLNQFFVVDPNTTGEPSQLNYDALMGVDCRLEKNSDGPQILIYHTHSQETFVDSVENDTNTSVVGVGNYLEEILEKDYGYEVLHLTNEFDVVDGQVERSKAYNYAAPVVEKTLEENPSIQVVIDLHRDGVPDDKHLVTEINGKPTAQIMFFNGLSRTRLNGENTSLPNPYIQDNLGFSFQMEYMAKRYYPNFVRCIYLKGYRYNLHLRPRSVLLEVGAQTNTVEEVKNAMIPFADILNKVLQGEG